MEKENSSCFSGYSTSLFSEDEKYDRLQELKVAIKAGLVYNSRASYAYDFTDEEIERFLSSCKFDVERAYERVMNTAVFRKQMGLKEMLLNDEEFLAQDQWGSAYWHKQDSLGRPVLVLRVCRHDPYNFSNETSTRYLLWKFYEGITRFQCNQVTVIFDFMHATRHNVDMKLFTSMLPIMQQHFPDMLGCCLIYPASVMFWVIWKMCRMIMDEDTVRKVLFIRESKKTKILKFFHPSQLEKRFGGTSEDIWDSEFKENVVYSHGGAKSSVEDDEDLDSDAYHRFLNVQDEKIESVRKMIKFKPGRIGSVREISTESRSSDAQAKVASLKPDAIPKPGSASMEDIIGSKTVDTTAINSVASDETNAIEAGTSLQHVSHMTTASEGKENAYTACDPHLFNVRRGPDYKRNRKKAKSKGPPIYDLVAVDLFQSDFKVPNIGSFVQVPEHILPPKTQQSKSGLPELLIINFLFPLYEPPNPVWGQKKEDGPGVCVVFFFRLSEWACEHPNHPAVKLWSRFVHCHEDDPFRDRMKFIFTMVNPEDMNMSRIERALNNKYNALPFLSRPEKCFKEQGYFEIDIDCHKYCYLARKTGFAILSRVNRMVLQMGGLIQAELDDEMPEHMLCCTTLHRLNMLNAPPIELDFTLDGTPSPRRKLQKEEQDSTQTKQADTKKKQAIFPTPPAKQADDIEAYQSDSDGEVWHDALDEHFSTVVV